MSHEEDLADVEAVLRGDVERFDGIVSRWEGPMVNLAWRFVRNEAIAEEMAQEAFVLCFRKLKQWRRESKFSTWLFSLATNLYRSMLRKRRLPISEGADLDALTGESTADAGFLEAERAEVVRRAVTHLPEIYRDAIVVYHFEEKDVATTAERLGIPPGTVKARLHRARKLLEQRLEGLIG